MRQTQITTIVCTVVLFIVIKNGIAYSQGDAKKASGQHNSTVSSRKGDTWFARSHNTAPAIGPYWDGLRERRRKADHFASRGESLRKEAKIAEAVVNLKQALFYDDRNTIAYEQLAEIYSDQGKWHDSVGMYRKLMSEGKTNWSNGLEVDYTHLIRYSIALHHASMTSEATAIYDRALLVAPTHIAKYLYTPDPKYVFDRKKMVASLRLALADMANDRARTGKKSEVDDNLTERLVEVKAAITIAPNYAPAHLMLGDALLFQSQYDSFHKRPDKAGIAKNQALQAYKRATSLGKGETKVAAQKGMQSSWFDDITKAAP